MSQQENQARSSEPVRKQLIEEECESLTGRELEMGIFLLLISVTFTVFVSSLCQSSDSELQQAMADREESMAGWNPVDDTARLLRDDVGYAQEMGSSPAPATENAENAPTCGGEIAGKPTRNTDFARPLDASIAMTHSQTSVSDEIRHAMILSREKMDQDTYNKLNTAFEMIHDGKHCEAFTIGWTGFEVGMKRMLSMDNGSASDLVRELGRWFQNHADELTIDIAKTLRRVDKARRVRNVCTHEGEDEQMKFADELKRAPRYIANMVIALEAVEEVQRNR